MRDRNSYKIVILGESATGKSLLLQKMLVRDYNSTYYSSTIGVVYGTVFVDNDNTTDKFDIWDTAGAERFWTIAQSYVHEPPSDLVIVIYNNDDSFNQLKKFFIMLKKLNHTGKTLLLFNPSNQQTEDEQSTLQSKGQQFASENECEFIQHNLSEITREGAIELISSNIIRKPPVNVYEELDPTMDSGKNPNPVSMTKAVLGSISMIAAAGIWVALATCTVSHAALGAGLFASIVIAAAWPLAIGSTVVGVGLLIASGILTCRQPAAVEEDSSSLVSASLPGN